MQNWLFITDLARSLCILFGPTIIVMALTIHWNRLLFYPFFLSFECILDKFRSHSKLYIIFFSWTSVIPSSDAKDLWTIYIYIPILKKNVYYLPMKLTGFYELWWFRVLPSTVLLFGFSQSPFRAIIYI